MTKEHLYPSIMCSSFSIQDKTTPVSNIIIFKTDIERQPSPNITRKTHLYRLM